MAKTLTIQIKPAAAALEGFGKTFKAVAAGRRVARRGGAYFTSIEAARNLLTPNRLALLRSIRTQRPRSIYEVERRGKRWADTDRERDNRTLLHFGEEERPFHYTNDDQLLKDFWELVRKVGFEP